MNVDDSFATGSTGWTGAFAGKFILAWRPVTIGGRPMVCGAYAITNIRLRPPVDNMLRQGTVQVGGRDVLRNLTFFNRVNGPRDEAAMRGTRASCAALPAGSDGQVSLTLGSGSFRN